MGMVDGKVGIVTGGTSGIGARTAELFVEEGAKVVFTGRRKAEGEALAKKLGAAARFVPADATLEDDWKRVIGETQKAFGGRLDYLFNNAGMGPGPRRGLASDIGGSVNFGLCSLYCIPGGAVIQRRHEDAHRAAAGAPGGRD